MPPPHHSKHCPVSDSQYSALCNHSSTREECDKMVHAMSVKGTKSPSSQLILTTGAKGTRTGTTQPIGSDDENSMPSKTAPRQSAHSGKPTARYGEKLRRDRRLALEVQRREKKPTQAGSANSRLMDNFQPLLCDAEATERSMAAQRFSTTLIQATSGHVNDPIDVEALPSPFPYRPVSHFANYVASLSPQYKTLRPNKSPTLLTPNGAQIESGKVSGHQSHEIYRKYMEIRDAPAPPGFTVSCARLSAEIAMDRSHSQSSAPSSYTGSSHSSGYGQTLDIVGGKSYAAPSQRQHQGYSHHHLSPIASYHTPVHGDPILPVMDEKQLRQRAVQFVLDHSRPRARKRRLSDDPDETSSSEYEDADEPLRKRIKVQPSADRLSTPCHGLNEDTESTPNTGSSEDNIFDRNLKLTELVEHTQLLTGMLMAYARSADQKGLREDIAMLATVTNKRLGSWESGEDRFDGDTQQRLSSAVTTWPEASSALPYEGKEAGWGTIEDMERNGSEESGIRKYLSAESEVWGRATRQG